MMSSRVLSLALLFALGSTHCIGLDSGSDSEPQATPQSPKPPISPLPWHLRPDSPCALAIELKILTPPQGPPPDEQWCRTRIIFVDADAPGGSGGPLDPINSLTQALHIAKDRPLVRAIALRGKGPFVSPGELLDGVSFLGGFYDDWRYTPSARAHLSGVRPISGEPSIGLLAQDINRDTWLRNIQLIAAPAPSGQSSYGILAQRSPGLRLARVDLLSGQGGDGQPGSPGRPGLHGDPGQDGAPGARPDPRHVQTWGGKGGAAMSKRCPHGPIPQSGQGGQGATPWSAPSPGDAALHAAPGLPGFDGQAGPAHDLLYAPGGLGGLATGSFNEDGLFMPALASRGLDGLYGLHGTSGAGGGGAYLGALTNGVAPGGGSGGLGGCGGEPGQGGQPGGSSFALVLAQSDGVIIDEANLYADLPGDGGAGGAGGRGGSGGRGGQGAELICPNVAGLDKPAFEACEQASAPAGDGGDGARAQDGGAGGGGAGGWSAAIVCLQSAKPVLRKSFLVPALGGQGGKAGGPDASPGAQGRSEVMLSCHD